MLSHGRTGNCLNRDFHHKIYTFYLPLFLSVQLSFHSSHEPWCSISGCMVYSSVPLLKIMDHSSEMFPLLQTRWDLEDQVHTSTFFDCRNFSVPSVYQSTWQLRNQHAQHFWSIHYTPLLAIWYAFTLQQEVVKLWNALASPNLIWEHSFSSLQYDSIL